MKRLNTDSITNELVNSSFFPARPALQPNIEATTPLAPQPEPIKNVEPIAVKPAPNPAPARLVPPTKPIPAAVPVSAPVGRRYTRRTFDFYEDQIAYLTKASFEDKLAGKEASMNSMVRDAVDSYIAAHKNK